MHAHKPRSVSHTYRLSKGSRAHPSKSVIKFDSSPVTLVLKTMELDILIKGADDFSPRALPYVEDVRKRRFDIAPLWRVVDVKEDSYTSRCVSSTPKYEAFLSRQRRIAMPL